MLCGHLAGTRGGAPRRVLDLGCGLGSVLLKLAWTFPEAERPGERGYGFSRVIDKSGKVLAAAKAECGEEIVIADLPLGKR